MRPICLSLYIYFCENVAIYSHVILQEELDKTTEVWNSHIIRPSRNNRVPSGRPTLMYYTPVLWGSEDQLCWVSEDDIEDCSTTADFRSLVPCDKDVYDICIAIMSRDNLQPAMDAFEAVNLYLKLQQDVMTLL